MSLFISSLSRWSANGRTRCFINGPSCQKDPSSQRLGGNRYSSRKEWSGWSLRSHSLSWHWANRFDSSNMDTFDRSNESRRSFTLPQTFYASQPQISRRRRTEASCPTRARLLSWLFADRATLLRYAGERSKGRYQESGRCGKEKDGYLLAVTTATDMVRAFFISIAHFVVAIFKWVRRIEMLLERNWRLWKKF